MLADVTDRWKLMLSGSYLRYALGDKSDDIRWYAGSRYTLSQNWALRRFCGAAKPRTHLCTGLALTYVTGLYLRN